MKSLSPYWILNFCRRLSSLLLLQILLIPQHLSGAEQTLSVLYFESLDKQQETLWMEKGIADTLISELSGVEGLILVERQQLEKVITELKLQLSGLTDESSASELGLLLSAGKLIMGSFSAQGRVLRINCRAVETATGKVIFSLSEEGLINDFSKIQQKLAAGVFQRLGLKKEAQLLQLENPSVQALTYYYRGLDLYDRKDYAEAAALMEKARQESPGFSKPGRTLEECYSFLSDFRRSRQLRELNKLYREYELLLNRLNRRPFVTYGEVISKAASAGEDIQKLNEKLKDDISWFRGDTPAQVLWNAQIIMFQIALKLQNDFNDTQAAESRFHRIIADAYQAGQIFAADPFFQEILYQEILALYMLKDWQELENSCFAFMKEYPDFRMIESVEDFYSKALESK